VRILAQPGDLIVAGQHQHLVSFEMGASARNSAVQFAVVNDDTGLLDVDHVAELIASELDHQPHVAMVSIENTNMYAGGVPWTAAQTRTLANALDGRPLHLDGARLFNAVVATGSSAAELCAPATTVMTCLSKGLAAPVGSLLAGSAELMDLARVERKRLGGAMRQAGFLAAAGLVSLTMVDRLADDHARARRIADAVAARFPESNYDPSTCRTNIVAFNHPKARQLVDEFAAVGLFGGTVSPRRARFVTHLDVDDDHVSLACQLIEQFVWR
jgi:threonine aldolase